MKTIGLILLVAVATSFIGRTNQEPKVSPAETDYQVFGVIFADLERRDLHTTAQAREGKKTQIIVSDRTRGGYPIPKDASVSEEDLDLSRRNQVEVSLKAYEPENKNVLVRDLSGLAKGRKRSEEFREKFPEAKVYITLRMPGYSKDGESATVHFNFGPTAHGAAATYKLARKGKGWTITHRKFSYFA